MGGSTYNYNTWLSEEDIFRCWMVTQGDLPLEAVSNKEMSEFLDFIDHVIESRTIH